MRDLVAGIDSSTQSCTVLLRRVEDGAVIAQAQAPHPPTTPPCSEQAPSAWWQALLDALDMLSDHLPRVAAVSVGAQGHGLVMLDEHGQPLRAAKLWNDTESAPDAACLRQQLPARQWAQRTGSVPAAALTVSKLAWMQRHHPGLLHRTRHILLPSDYLIFRLTGRAISERGVASGTGYFNPFGNHWEPQLAALAAPGLDWPRVLPELIDSSAVSGEISALKALHGAIAGAGTGDNMAAGLGLGIVPGDTVVSLGTSGTMYGLSTTGIVDESGAINGYADASGAFLPMITTLNCAKVTDAFRRLLNVTSDAFDALALSAPPGARGVVLVPYLDGERCPDLPDACGALYGLRSDVGPEQLARAAVEAVVCNLLEGGEHLARHGLAGHGRLIVTGGAARSSAYRQILADLSGRAVWTCGLQEAAAAGAAVQAAAALTGKTTAQVAQQWRPEYRIVAEPDFRSQTWAQAVRQAYRRRCERITQEPSS